MQSELLLVTLAQIGVIVAGFAGLLSGAHVNTSKWTRLESYSLQTLVILGS